MPKLILMCGLPCSGKTTLAKQLAEELPALRVSPDEWITTLYGSSPEKKTLDDMRYPVEALGWQVAEQALRLGLNVILDYGFWSKEERDDYRARGTEIGADVEIRYISVDLPSLQLRLEERNANLPEGTFDIAQEDLRKWFTMFEEPTEKELS